MARFTPQEAQVLRQCMAELAELISNDPDPDDPAVERLFPDVYPEDPTEQAEFRRFTEADLKAAKLDQAKTVLTDLLANRRRDPASRKTRQTSGCVHSPISASPWAPGWVSRTRPTSRQSSTRPSGGTRPHPGSAN